MQIGLLLLLFCLGFAMPIRMAPLVMLLSFLTLEYVAVGDAVHIANNGLTG